VYPEDQFRAKVLVELTSGASSIDVFMSMPAQEGLKYVRAGWLQPVDEFLMNPALTAPDYNGNDFLEKTHEAMVIEGKIISPPIQVENTSLIIAGFKTRTLPIAVYSFLSYEKINWGGLTAAATVITLPVLLLALFVPKHIVRGLTLDALKG
jgi:hypothetical protein